MSFLVEEFGSLTYLVALLSSEDSPKRVCKSVIVPNESIFFEDEKYKLEILDKLAVDAQLSGKPEVSVCRKYIYVQVYVHLLLNTCNSRIL